MTAPLVTTIIPTYRRPTLLKRAIISALAQGDLPLQVCIYDNASGDDTSAVVSQLASQDTRIKYHCHAQNIGSFENFQFALKHVDTPFFSILSDDDVLLPGFYATALADLAGHPNAGLWCGATIKMTDTGTVYGVSTHPWPRTGLYSSNEALMLMASGNAPTWTGILARKIALDSAGFLDCDVGSAADMDWLLRVVARHPLFISKMPAALFVLHDSSFSESAPFSAIWPAWLKVVEKAVAIETLTDEEKKIITGLLRALGKKLTFRHAAYALTKGDHPYANEAARIQHEFFKDRYSYLLLHSLSQLCAGSNTFQHAYSWLYKLTVSLALARRRDLQKRYGHLARYLVTDSA